MNNAHDSCYFRRARLTPTCEAKPDPLVYHIFVVYAAILGAIFYPAFLIHSAAGVRAFHGYVDHFFLAFISKDLRLPGAKAQTLLQGIPTSWYNAI
jgi:hypothetical protein